MMNHWNAGTLVFGQTDILDDATLFECFLNQFRNVLHPRNKSSW